MVWEWPERAACRGLPPRIFFPERGGRAADCYAEARSICESCKVRWECLDEALRFEYSGYRCGMRGGMSPDQRDRWARFTGVRRTAMVDA